MDFNYLDREGRAMTRQEVHQLPAAASTLVRQALARKPALLANKKVLVWEFI